MTIQHSIDTMQAWTHALRIIMGYPACAPIGHTITFASGGRRDPVEALQIAAIVEQIGYDIVCPTSFPTSASCGRSRGNFRSPTSALRSSTRGSCRTRSTMPDGPPDFSRRMVERE